ncbi:DUF6255 family natural product biosynthesis protein [Streptomyces morookaense]|uniref:DUF6255 family natural product biosynthesis protein n=1 Tax=Streptomyces morookaense TaxID=1970 RepID=UPI0033DB91B9
MAPTLVTVRAPHHPGSEPDQNIARVSERPANKGCPDAPYPGTDTRSRSPLCGVCVDQGRARQSGSRRRSRRGREVGRPDGTPPAHGPRVNNCAHPQGWTTHDGAAGCGTRRYPGYGALRIEIPERRCSTAQAGNAPTSEAVPVGSLPLPPNGAGKGDSAPRSGPAARC